MSFGNNHAMPNRAMTLSDAANHIRGNRSYFDRLLKRHGRDPYTRGNIKCPCPQNHNNGDETPSARYYWESGRVHCHGCKWSGDIFDFMIAIGEATDWKDAVRQIANEAGIEIISSGKKQDHKPSKPAPSLSVAKPKPELVLSDKQLAENKKFIERTLADIDKASDYLASRGISIGAARRLGVGFDVDKQRLIYPTDNGAYKYRNLKAERPEYRFRHGGGGKPSIFNRDALRSATAPIFVCEGEFDAKSFIEVGFDAVAISSTSGVDMFLAEVANNKPAQPLIIAMDSDKAGYEAADKLMAGLLELGVLAIQLNVEELISIYGNMPNKDANDRLMADRVGFEASVAKLMGSMDAYEESKAILDDYVASKQKSESEPSNANTDKQQETPRMICLADVKEQPVVWLWQDYIPENMLTIVAGQPGAGKSYFALYLAATVSNGGKWTDGEPCPAGGVVLAMAEDTPEHVIKPRFKAIGGNSSKIQILSCIDSFDEAGNPYEKAWTLKNIPMLRQAIINTPNCKLVIIDPIGSYMGGNTDIHRDNEIRAMLTPLAGLAAELNVAIVCVCHTGKSTVGRSVDNQILGSIGFGASARSILHVGADPDDINKPSLEQNRLVAAGKTNLCERPPTLSFKLIKRNPNDKKEYPSLGWATEPDPRSAEELFGHNPKAGQGRPAEERDTVEKFIVDELTAAGGEVPAKEIKAKCEEKGFAKNTINRAKEQLKLKPIKSGDGGKTWMWSLNSRYP